MSWVRAFVVGGVLGWVVGWVVAWWRHRRTHRRNRSYFGGDRSGRRREREEMIEEAKATVLRAGPVIEREIERLREELRAARGGGLAGRGH